MRWEFSVALRHLRSRHRLGFISVVTWFSVAGITIGTGALIIVLAVMSGFESEVRGRIIGLDAHLRVRSFHDRGIAEPQEILDLLADLPGLVGMSPYVIEKGMLRHRGSTESAVIRGMDTESLRGLLPLEEHLLAGDIRFEPEGEGELPGILLGRYLAAGLGVIPGDTLLVISPTGLVSAFSQPVVRRFAVRGIFELGIYEFDDAIAFVGLKQAQSLFRLGQSVSGIEIRLKDLNRADEVKEEIGRRLDYPYAAWTWFEMHKNLFSMMKLEKWMMFIMLSLIVLVAAFNIISTLTMVTMERRREIGILKAMGADSRSIARIFIGEGLLLGGSGTLAGSLVGLALCWIQLRWQPLSLPPDVYFISTFPVELRLQDILLITCSALLISLAATLYPAVRAARLHPVEAIRHDG